MLLLLEDLALIYKPNKALIIKEELLIINKGYLGLVLLNIKLNKLVSLKELV
jgi:hypothetical protein